LWSTIATDSNKKMFNLFTDELGKSIGKHQVMHKPSIGRYTNLEEPKPHQSILSPGMRKSPSTANLLGGTSPTATSPSIAPSLSSTLKPPSSSSSVQQASSSDAEKDKKLSVDINVSPSTSLPNSSSTLSVPDTAQGGITPMVQAVNARLMERTHFAIDDVGDSEDEDEDEDDEDDDADDQVMDEVDAFLEAHDSGLTDADKKVAEDLLHAEPVK